MESPSNKKITTGKEGKVEDHAFMFPHQPNPITVYAQNIEEATKKFEAIIKKEKNEE